MVFKDLGKQDNNRDTLYFNAFTEDLFFWDNDLVNDTDRVLVLNDSSTFLRVSGELELDNRIRPLLQKYVDFDFRITQEKHRKEADKRRNLKDGRFSFFPTRQS